MTTATTERHLEPICPPWCEGHDGIKYQAWEDRCDGTGQIREHSGPGIAIGELAVEIGQTEKGNHDLEPPVVSVYVACDRADLTPAQTRALAAALVAAAERAEARG